jgi:replicative superfamily II helicase
MTCYMNMNVLSFGKSAHTTQAAVVITKDQTWGKHNAGLMTDKSALVDTLYVAALQTVVVCTPTTASWEEETRSK